MEYKSTKPYPPIEVSAPNPYFGEILLEDLGGIVSEMSAISLYMYNNTIIVPELEELKLAFKKINMVEMEHLQILNELVLQLGVDPRLWTNNHGQCQYWTPFYNTYPNQLDALLMNSIKSEQQAIEQYQKHIQCIQDPKIIAILERIIEDEIIHLNIFQSFYNSLVYH